MRAPLRCSPRIMFERDEVTPLKFRLDVLVVAGILRDLVVDGRINRIYLYVFPAMIFLQALATYLERVNPSWWQAATLAILGA
jgi:hypothetical protein